MKKQEHIYITAATDFRSRLSNQITTQHTTRFGEDGMGLEWMGLEWMGLDGMGVFVEFLIRLLVRTIDDFCFLLEWRFNRK